MENFNEQTPQAFTDREKEMFAGVEGELTAEGERFKDICDLTSGLVEARKDNA